MNKGQIMSDDTQKIIYRKVMWKLLPVCMLMFFFSLLDRTNISFAALEMNKDLGLAPTQYGTAASMFFIGYLLFEIPSNYMLVRFGARIWLARIMITWGLVVAAMCLVQGVASLYSLRFLLGVAEAGLLPGLLLYLSQWLPTHQRGKAYAFLMMTNCVAYAIGAPLTTTMMQWPIAGLSGWQAMFLLQGLVTVAFGVAVYWMLTDKISNSAWLSDAEQAALNAELAREEAIKKTAGATRMRDAFLDPRVLLVAVALFALICVNFGAVLWLPQILRGIFPDLTNIQISLLITLAFAIGAVGGVLNGRHSDRTGERKWHLVAGMLVTAVGYGAAGAFDDATWRFVAICLAIVGLWSILGVFWAYCGDLLGGEASAGGFAFINSIGAVGGIVGPWVLGYALQKVGNMSGPLYSLMGFAVVTAIFFALLKKVPIHAK
jgi:ACS family tartrate transporter-like MFS transporter